MAKSRKARLRFSLRAMLVLVACISTVLAALHARAVRQRRIIKIVQQFKGAAAYDYNRLPSTNRMPRWWDDYFCSITQIVLNDTDVSDEDLVKLAPLTGLRVLSLQNTAITDNAVPCFEAWDELEWVDLKGTRVSDAAADELRRRHPNCEIETHWMRGCGRCRTPFPTRDIGIYICPKCKSSPE